MSGQGRNLVRHIFRTLRPRPRIVDWSIFVAVIFETCSGILSILGATPAWAPLFWAHRIVGLTLIVLLAFKLSRVRYRLTDSGQWQPSTLLSIVTLLAAAGTIGTGVVWVFGVDPPGSITLVTVHALLGILTAILMSAHLWTRFRKPRRVDFQRRRTTLQYSALLVAGAVTYRSQEAANAVLGTDGEDRRFTGSQRREGEGNDAFPATSWVADDPDRIDLDEWTLTVRGLVDDRLELDYTELSTDAEREALLDCTSGWYTVQDWRGVRVGDLLDAAAVDDDAAFVRFVSVTGYRWTLPLDEARDALLATHVGGSPLSHGHGRPLRLVAPDRRGFQWVKWIERIDVRRRGDLAQWLVILISGFTD
jgi:DMSO/TMAO reductase YedYZ molybdopterin-dependent catalytic subunit